MLPENSAVEPIRRAMIPGMIIGLYREID